MHAPLKHGFAPWQSAASLNPAPKRHVLLRAGEIEALKIRIGSNEPRASAYFDALSFAVPTWRSATPRAPERFQVAPFYQDASGHRQEKGKILHDATAAYGLALHFRLAGDDMSARAAVRFLRPWFESVAYTTDPETCLVLSYTFPILIYAADLLDPAPLAIWTQNDREKFSAFLGSTLLDFNTSERANNWGNWGNLLRMSIAAYRDDRVLFDLTVDRHKELIRDQIGTENQFIHEVVRNQGRGEQGIGYSHFALGPLAMSAQIALGRGVDLFNYVSPNGRSMEPAWRQLAAWTAAPETFPYFKERNGSEMENVTTIDFDFFDRTTTGLFPIRMGYFELLQKRWPVRAAEEILAETGPQGLDVTGTQWVGLMHSGPVQAGVPSVVKTLGVDGIFRGKVKLIWEYADAGVTHFEIERRSASGAWEALATPDAVARSFIDEASIAAATEYRIRAVSSIGSSPFWSGPAATGESGFLRKKKSARD